MFPTTRYLSGETHFELVVYGLRCPDTYSAVNIDEVKNFRFYRSGVWEGTQEWFGAYPSKFKFDSQDPLTSKDKFLSFVVAAIW